MLAGGDRLITFQMCPKRAACTDLIMNVGFFLCFVELLSTVYPHGLSVRNDSASILVSDKFIHARIDFKLFKQG